MPIEVIDDVENKTVANGAAITVIAAPAGEPARRGVTNCVVVAGQELQTNYSYRLHNTAPGTDDLSVQYLTGPGAGMMIATFQLNT